MQWQDWGYQWENICPEFQLVWDAKASPQKSLTFRIWPLSKVCLIVDKPKCHIKLTSAIDEVYCKSVKCCVRTTYQRAARKKFEGICINVWLIRFLSRRKSITQTTFPFQMTKWISHPQPHFWTKHWISHSQPCRNRVTNLLSKLYILAV